MVLGKIAKVPASRRDSYLELIQAFPLRPIRTDVELDAAIRVIDIMIDKEVLDSGEADYLDVLSDLVHRYETENCPLGEPTDAAFVSHLLEAKSLTQADAARKAHVSNSTLSEVLAGTRQLTRGQIEKLAHCFGIMPAAFLRSAI